MEWSIFFCIQAALDFCNVNTHTRLFKGPLFGTTRVSRYQKGKTNLDFTEAKDREWQWHQLGHAQVCTSLQRDNHASTHHSLESDATVRADYALVTTTTTPPLSFYTRIPFLSPNQQCQSTTMYCKKIGICKIEGIFSGTFSKLFFETVHRGTSTVTSIIYLV